MARIVILGGNGKIAQLLARHLSGAGDTVMSVIRNPDQADHITQLGAEPLVADLEQLSTEEIAGLIAGSDAVVWSAGAGGGNPPRTYAVDRDAAIRSIDAAERAGVQRYVMVSYFGADENHGVSPDHSFFAYAEAKAAADTHLRASSLAWTILGPSSLTLEPASGRIDASATASGSVSRENVALTIQATLADATTARRTIRFNDGDTPIAEALREASAQQR